MTASTAVETVTKKYLQRYGERLVCVRYLHDAANGCRHKTVELDARRLGLSGRVVQG